MSPGTDKPMQRNKPAGHFPGSFNFKEGFGRAFLRAVFSISVIDAAVLFLGVRYGCRAGCLTLALDLVGRVSVESFFIFQPNPLPGPWYGNQPGKFRGWLGLYKQLRACWI